MQRFSLPAAIVGIAALLSGCEGSPSEADQRDQVSRAMQESMQADLTALLRAAGDLRAAAPVAAGRGWDAGADAAAIAAMRAAWARARTAYEHVEGATAPIFPDIDADIDGRYDDFLAQLAPAGDPDLFDGQGVTGMHAVERIIYSDVTPPAVIAAESALPGYVPAAFPATEAQATAFRDGLCARLVDDTRALVTGWTPQRIDVGGAFQGLVGLLDEQQEKVNKAARGEEESRYSQHTLADLRDNLAGTETSYALFRPWLRSKSAAGGIPAGGAIDAAIMQGFAALGVIYASVPGDALPQPPPTWDAVAPTAADLATPFGTLYAAVHQAVDPAVDGSLVSRMNQAAALLGIPGFEGE